MTRGGHLQLCALSLSTANRPDKLVAQLPRFPRFELTQDPFEDLVRARSLRVRLVQTASLKQHSMARPPYRVRNKLSSLMVGRALKFQ